MDTATILVILAGALAGGVVNGMTSFGTALASLPFLLQVLEPIVAAQLVALASVAGQFAGLRELWPKIDWHRTGPLILAGLAGLPLGLAIVPYIDPTLFKLMTGVILVAYCALMLLANGRLRIPEGGRPRTMAVGFAGGILGGVAGLSGVLVTIWGTLENWSKDRRRATSHGYNLIILAAMLGVQAVMGRVSLSTVPIALLALPATMLGVLFGSWLARRLSDRRYDRVVLVVLLIGGIGLVARSL